MRRVPLPSLLVPLVALCLGPACLDPQVDDEVTGQRQVLPPGTELPTIDDDPMLAAQIAQFDNVDGVIPAISAFAGGMPVQYWNFGPSPDYVVPLYYLIEPDTGRLLTEHGPIFDFIPGDDRYSPYWAMVLLPITDAYNGEIIPSVSAVEEANRLGLIDAPMAIDTFVNCPVVASDVRLDMGDGEPGVAPALGVYRGVRVPLYDLNRLLSVPPRSLGEDATRVDVGYILSLRREDGLVLSEPQRGVDITLDGDRVDTNDIIRAPGLAGVQPMRRVSVVLDIGAAGQLIDESLDDATSDLAAANQLFADGAGDLIPNNPDVIAFEIGDQPWNLPFRIRPGTLAAGAGR